MPMSMTSATRPLIGFALAMAASSAALANPPATAPLAAQDVAVLAATCANCHGPGGQSVGGMPTLRGLPAGYLQERMLAFKAGTAKDATVMTRLMKGYDETQIQALSQWFGKEGK